MMGRLVRGGVAAALALAAFAPSALAEETSLWRLSPESISTYGHEVDSLYAVILWLTVVTFVITEGLLVVFLLKFRAKPGGRATYTHGNHRLEVIWTIVPAVLLFWLALYQVGAWKRIKLELPNRTDALIIQVMGRQFEWQFRYAGPDGRFATEDDVVQVGEFHVPVNRPVILQLRGYDTLHSFFVPALRLKQDTVPGLTIEQWFEATKTTARSREERNAPTFHYEVACAELCGIGHTTMRALMVVEEEAEFFRWLDKAYVADAREFGPDPKLAINKAWPATGSGGKPLVVEDAWLRSRWPEELKAAWPKLDDGK